MFVNEFLRFRFFTYEDYNRILYSLKCYELVNETRRNMQILRDEVYENYLFYYFKVRYVNVVDKDIT